MSPRSRCPGDLTQEALDRVIDVDVKGTLLCTHEFGARTLEQGHGAIVNIGSTVIARGSARPPAARGVEAGLRAPRHVRRRGNEPVTVHPITASTATIRSSLTWMPGG